MKKFMSSLMVLVICLTTLTYADDNRVFKDIENHWAKTEINLLVSKGLVYGVSATEIAPNKTLKEYEWHVMLNRILDQSQNATNKESLITREQAVLTLYNRMNISLTEPATPPFKDAIDLAAESKNAISWAVENKLILGNPQGYFFPNKTLTRAEGFVIMSRLVNMNDFMVSENAGTSSDVKAVLSKQSDGQLQLTVSWGQKNTGGYSVTIVSHKIVNNQLFVDVRLKSPAPDAVVTQALTYPKAVLVLANKGIDISKEVIVNIVQ